MSLKLRSFLVCLCSVLVLCSCTGQNTVTENSIAVSETNFSTESVSFDDKGHATLSTDSQVWDVYDNLKMVKGFGPGASYGINVRTLDGSKINDCGFIDDAGNVIFDAGTTKLDATIGTLYSLVNTEAGSKVLLNDILSAYNSDFDISFLKPIEDLQINGRFFSKVSGTLVKHSDEIGYSVDDDLYGYTNGNYEDYSYSEDVSVYSVDTDGNTLLDLSNSDDMKDIVNFVVYFINNDDGSISYFWLGDNAWENKSVSDVDIVSLGDKVASTFHTVNGCPYYNHQIIDDWDFWVKDKQYD